MAEGTAERQVRNRADATVSWRSRAALSTLENSAPCARTFHAAPWPDNRHDPHAGAPTAGYKPHGLLSRGRTHSELLSLEAKLLVLFGLHGFVERANQVPCDGLQASVFDVQELIFAVACRSRPQHNFPRRVHQIDGGFIGGLRAEVHSLQHRVGLRRRSHNLQRSMKLAGYLRRQVLIEMVLHGLDVNLVD